MAAPTKYSDAQYAFEYTLPTANAQETDTLVVLVVSGALLSTAQWDTLTSTNFVFTDVSGNLIPSYLVSFDGTGDTMQCWVRWPNVSTVAAQAVYMQWGGTISRSNDSAAFTGDDYQLYYPAGDSAGPTIVDACGNANATAYNSPTFGASGQAGAAIDLERDSSQYADSSPTLGTGALSIGLMVKPETTNNYAGLLIAKTNDATNGFLGMLHSNDNSGRFYVYVPDVADGVGNQRALKNEILTAGTWYDVVLTWDGSSSTPSLYVNAAPKTIVAPVANAATSSCNFCIGASGGVASGEYYDGAIQHVFKRSGEMSALYATRRHANLFGSATDAIFAAGDYTVFASGVQLGPFASAFASPFETGAWR